MRTSTIVVILLVLVAIVGGWAMSGIRPFNKAAPVPGGTVCTADAMQCPDGSYVGRSGPDCAFVCPVATTTTTTSGGGVSVPPGGQGIAPYHSGVRGTIVAGPTCPVMRNPPEPGCEDKPLATTVAVFRKSNPTTPFAIGKSDAQGMFTFALPPGEYLVGAGESTLPRCTQTPATVGPNTYTNIVVQCDTGIR